MEQSTSILPLTNFYFSSPAFNAFVVLTVGNLKIMSELSKVLLRLKKEKKKNPLFGDFFFLTTVKKSAINVPCERQVF